MGSVRQLTRLLAPIALAVAGLAALTLGRETAIADEQADAKRTAQAMHVLDTYCVSCHGPEQQKGGVRFNNLETIDTVDLQDYYLKAQDAVHFNEMPPSKAKQPSDAERKLLLDWLSSQLTGEAAHKLAEKMRRPEAGNYVNHEDLFSGEYADLPGYTEDRRWLISEFIFDAKFNRILNHTPFSTIDGKRQFVIGSNNRRVNLTNPFLLPTHAGVRYYANETLNGGHLLTMLTNAKEASGAMMELAGRDKRYLPAVSEIMAMRDQHAATLASRERFLNLFAERVLEETFGDRHAALLPKFERVAVPDPIPNDGSVKKAPFHAANPGQQELVLIFKSMRRHQREGISDAELIEACEREWFYSGDDARRIAARITFLNNYMEEWRGQIEQHKYDERNREIEYKEPAPEEMQAIQAALKKNREPGDRYNAIIAKCLAQWASEFEQQREAAGPPSNELLEQLVGELFVKLYERQPTAAETQKYAALTASYVENLGNHKAIEKLIQTLILNTEFVYRNEFGVGEPDAYGRRMMSPRDLSYAIAYALTDSSPDAELAKAAAEDRLTTRADVEREVRRMLANRAQHYIVDERLGNGPDYDSFTNMPIRELRFFREFFGYPRLLGIFKDRKRFGGDYDNAKVRLVIEADRLVEHILEEDKDVFNKLLTTDAFYVFHSGDNEQMKADSDRIRKIYDYFNQYDWWKFTLEDLRKHKDFIAETKMRGIDANRLAGPDRRYDPLRTFMTQMESFDVRLGNGQTAAAPYPSFPAHGPSNGVTRFGGRLTPIDVAKFYNIDLTDWDYPTTQPAKVENRKGMLTHPAWLIAFAQNTETDPIHRGIWVREKLLAGTIPDVPITVDAVIPEDPHKTMRQRLDAKTNNDYCMSCHDKINPLGVTFEIYDDFGRYRTQERLEYPENLIEKVKDKGAPHEDLRDIYKTLPVDARGALDGTGDPRLDGEVDDALDLIDRLAKSDRVRQSIIRHAFRYFMGRNETLSDSKTLIDAERAYLESGGSFDELIVSLLTSDSFIYRKPQAPEAKADANP